MKLETRITKLEGAGEPEFAGLAERILAAHKAGYQFPSRAEMAELEERAKRYGGLWQRILDGRRRAEPPMTPERLAKLEQIVAEHPEYQTLLDHALQRAYDSGMAEKRTRTHQAASTKVGLAPRPRDAPGAIVDRFEVTQRRNHGYCII